MIPHYFICTAHFVAKDWKRPSVKEEKKEGD